jgi:two-component system cell cycle response regulator
MTGRILVVDDILANLKLLEARLSAEYFDVLTAEDGIQALAVLDRERVDLVLLDVMMPGLDGYEVCRRIKASPATMQIPVVLLTALDQPDDKLKGLEAGADDFLSKPVEELALLTRVKNLTRLKALNDEMTLRAADTPALGVAAETVAGGPPMHGRVLLIEDDALVAAEITAALAAEHTVTTAADGRELTALLAETDFDIVISSLDLRHADGLRLCSQVRALPRTRHVPLIVLVTRGDEARLLRGFDIGVNDYINRPVDRNELTARVRTQLRRKRYSDHLREKIDETVGLAMKDGLTGLNNRRFMEAFLKAQIERCVSAGKPLSLLIADIDHFKSINDTWGHDGGDAVLREIANRLRRDTRGGDMACRLGGEEFVVVMPETDLETAGLIGERLRYGVASSQFSVPAGVGIDVTLSVGLTALQPGDTLQTLMKRADVALYLAKNKGRNRVVAEAA